jgi:hypothetical protein
LIKGSIVYGDLRTGVKNIHKRMAIEENGTYAFREVD